MVNIFLQQRFLPQLGRNHKKLGFRAENAGCVLRDKRTHFLHRFLVFQDVGFVHHKHNFLAPREDFLQEEPLAFGQRSVRRRGEQDQVAARHILVRQNLMLADDGIRAGGIHDIQFLQHLKRVGEYREAFVHNLLARFLTPAHQRHAGCGRGHAFAQNPLAQQRVY